jgi:TfoX/Sxy family transcriptional regulator of competence genes
MAWSKSPPELIARFDAAFPDGPGVEQRQMFGFPAGFVNGNMFCGLFEAHMLLRLADAARHEMLKLPGAKIFEPMPGRPMREYVTVSPAVLGDPVALARWTKRALDYASSLPPKKPKAKKPGAPKAKARPKASPRSPR